MYAYYTPKCYGCQEDERVFKNAAIVPPSYRFPPLREGNQNGSLPPDFRENLKEGVRNFAYFRTPSEDDEGGSKTQLLPPSFRFPLLAGRT